MTNFRKHKRDDVRNRSVALPACHLSAIDCAQALTGGSPAAQTNGGQVPAELYHHTKKIEGQYAFYKDYIFEGNQSQTW
jgi:hypothetical protein